MGVSIPKSMTDLCCKHHEMSSKSGIELAQT